MIGTVRVGTRASPLARRQTELAIRALRRRDPRLRAEVIVLETRGDRDRRPGKTADFTSALEAALRSREIDIAVHSAKDLLAQDAAGLSIAAYPRRADPRDCLVLGPHGGGPRARIGSSSLRRRAQLLRWRPGLKIVEIRGNVDTRLGLVRDGRVDGVILAKAGIDRLGRTDEIGRVLSSGRFLPAPGQGALALQVRAQDRSTRKLVAPVDHLPTRRAVEAERAAAVGLSASCDVPLGALATVSGGALTLRVEVLSLDGRQTLKVVETGRETRSAQVGVFAARHLLRAGARKLLSGS